MANEFYVDPTGGINPNQKWNQLSSSLQGLGQQLRQDKATEEQAKQQQAQQQRLAQGKATVQAAVKSGNPDAVADAMIEYPELSELMQGAISYKSDTTKQNMIDSSIAVLSNPENAEQILTDRIKLVQSQGGDATQSIEALEEFRTNPEQAIKSAQTFVAFNDPEGYKQFKSATTGNEMTPYQEATIKLKERGQTLQEMEMQQRSLDRQLSSETNNLKREELQLKVDQTKQELEQKKSEYKTEVAEVKSGLEESVLKSNDAIELINGIRNHEGFKSYIGAKGASSLFGVLDEPVAGSAASGVAGMVETLKSQNFLDQIQNMKGMGALSNAEGEKVSAAVASLNPDMREEDFEKSLKVIETNMTRAKAKAENQYKSAGGDPSSIGKSTDEANVVNWGDM